MFETDRLILRAFRDSDMVDLMRLANDADIQRLVSNEYLVPKSVKSEDAIKGLVRTFT